MNVTDNGTPREQPLPEEAAPRAADRKKRRSWEQIFRYVHEQKKHDEQAGIVGRTVVAAQRVWVFARPHAWLILWVLLITLLGQGMTATFPLAFGYLFDRVLTGDNMELLHAIAAGLLCFVALQAFLLYVGRRLLTVLGILIIRDIRLAVHAHLLAMSVGYLEDFQAGRAAARIIQDTEEIRSMLHQFLMTLFSNTVRLICVLGAMFWIDWRLTLASCGILPFFSWRVNRLIKRMKPAAKELSEDNAQLLARTTETFTNVRLVKSCARERREQLKFMRRIHLMLRKRLAIRNTHYFIISLWEFSSWVGLVLMVWYGGYLVMTQELSLGQLVSFYGLMGLFTAPISLLLRSNETVQMAFASLERIHEVLSSEPDIQDRKRARDVKRLEGNVQFDGVSFSYPTRSEAAPGEADPTNRTLKDVSFEVKAGQSVALVGPSGSGKTTLTLLLSRLYDVQDGSVQVDGVDLRDYLQHSYRRQIGMVLQESMIFLGTVRENIAYAKPDATEGEIIRAAQLAQAWSFIQEMPEGLDAPCGERGTLLSGGQRQRISIARAFLADPRILILDEATSSLDSQAEAQIQEALGTLMKGRTTFIIAHRLSTIVNADLILVLDQGQIVERGTHEELLANGGLYSQLYQEQFRDVLATAQPLLESSTPQPDSDHQGRPTEDEVLARDRLDLPVMSQESNQKAFNRLDEPLTKRLQEEPRLTNRVTGAAPYDVREDPPLGENRE